MDPNDIIVSDRQRSTIKLDEHFVQSVARRLIHPIVLRRQDGEVYLVAGGKRLAALKQAGLTDLEENTHYRFIEDLSLSEARVLELEENIKREDLPWRDHAKAFGDLFNIYKTQNPTWNNIEIYDKLNVAERTGKFTMFVFRNLASPLLEDAQSITQAYSILQLAADRKSAQIVSEISNVGTKLFQDAKADTTLQTLQVPVPASNSQNGELGSALELSDSPQVDLLSGNVSSSVPSEAPQQEDQQPIRNLDFLKWLSEYNLPQKFNLIHCDFPYDIQYDSYAGSVTSSREDYDAFGYWLLLDAMLGNLDKFVSYSAHIVFWFSMDFYEKTKTKLESKGLFVVPKPLIWHKTDNAGIIPSGNRHPRHVYETAFLASRGKRPLIKSLSDHYGAPTPSNPIHPSQKSEPMLRYFLGMLVDDTTDFLDPTCGSGAAVRAADSLNARSVLGLELNPSYASTALSLTLTERRKAGR